jgi:hypothetical protein
MTAEERTLVYAVVREMRAATDLPENLACLDEAELIGSGFPERIAPVARAALVAMLERGRFSEEVEEDVPSDDSEWSYGPIP